MTRALLPGRRDYDDGIARPLRCHRCDCDQCSLPCTCETELANTVPMRKQLVRSVPTRVPVQLSGGRIPFARRVRRFVRALFHFLLARKADLS